MPFDAAGSQRIDWRNFFLCFGLSLGQFGFGYPASIISFTLSNPDFLEYTGLQDAQGLNEGLVGATNGVFQAGAVINIILTVIMLEKYGRKKAIYFDCFWGLLGGALAAGARNTSMFIVARFFLGASSFGLLALIPIYTAELSPPHTRGFFSGMNGFNISFSYAVAGYMGIAFFYTTSPRVAWRGPLGLYLVFPVALCIMAYFSPESPRWLLLQERVDEAKAVIYNLHGHKSLAYAQEEFYQMQKQVEIDRTLDTSWLIMFTKRSYLKRTAVCSFYAFLGQSTAVLVINNYGPTFYKSLGYGTVQQLNFQIGWLTIGFPFCFLGAALLDRAGRRPLMILGIAGCCACDIVLAASQARLDSNPSSLGALGVSALFIFLAIYSVGVDVGANVYYAEIFPNHIRTKGVAIANTVLALADLVYLQVTPMATATIGWKFFLVRITYVIKQGSLINNSPGIHHHHGAWVNSSVFCASRNEQFALGGDCKAFW